MREVFPLSENKEGKIHKQTYTKACGGVFWSLVLETKEVQKVRRAVSNFGAFQPHVVFYLHCHKLVASERENMFVISQWN